jgi:hypothetical protein
MSRPLRLLVTLGAMAVLGTGALSYLARQYGKHAAAVAGRAEARAAALVASLLTLGAAEEPDDAALAREGISREDYRRVHRAALDWASSGRADDPALTVALEARAGEVRRMLTR